MLAIIIHYSLFIICSERTLLRCTRCQQRQGQQGTLLATAGLIAQRVSCKREVHLSKQVRLRVQGPTHIRPGYELGVTFNKDFFVFNHLVFNVLFHKTGGHYTRTQANAYAKWHAVDTTGRRLLAWLKDTPAEVCTCQLSFCCISATFCVSFSCVYGKLLAVSQLELLSSHVATQPRSMCCVACCASHAV